MVILSAHWLSDAHVLARESDMHCALLGSYSRLSRYLMEGIEAGLSFQPQHQEPSRESEMWM